MPSHDTKDQPATENNAAGSAGRTIAIVALVVSILLVIAVLVGARVVYDRAAKQPVGISPLPAPLAESTECSDLVANLPDEVIGHDRATIVEPVPPGTAAWASSSQERVTLRCGVDLPLQYTAYSEPVEIHGVQWLEIKDATPESTLSTWYTVNLEPVVAVTADEPTLGRHDNPVAGISALIGELPTQEHEPHPTPLSELEAAEDPQAAQLCAPLAEELPEVLADAWHIQPSPTPGTAVWTNPGHEPIVLRCGVAPPPNYQAGEMVTQIDDVAWFEDATLVNGSTASIWYALGRATDIAVSTPMAASSQVLPELTPVIERAVAPEGN